MGDYEFVRGLRALGMETVTAEDFAEYICTVIDKRVATKADLTQANLQHTAEMARLETRLVGKMGEMQDKMTWRLVTAGLVNISVALATLIKLFIS